MGALGLMFVAGVVAALGPPVGPDAQRDCRMRLVAVDAAEAAKWSTFQRVFVAHGYATAIGPATPEGARAELSIVSDRSKCTGTLTLRWPGLDSNGNPMAVVDTVLARGYGRRGCEKARVKLLGKLWTDLERCG